MKKCPRCGVEYSDTTTLCPADGTALETTGDPLVGETLAGKYRIDERISVGGMGAVYRGTHILMDKKVAIKVLRPSLAADETIVARFSREARAASKISHPHALSVTDFGEAEGGVVFLVMELLNGLTLKQIIKQDGPLPLTRVVEIIRQVGGALDVAHAEGVIHRDLKSDNIMLISTGGTDYAKVLDFGIAKIQEPVDGHDSSITSPDLIIGTPQYMSPEQCSQAEELDARSDVYSLGVILYEMLVGCVPFSAESPTGIMLKHLQEPPPSVLDSRRDLPRCVDTVVSKALAKRPEDRYQSVNELVEDLVIAGGNELVQPVPVPPVSAKEVPMPVPGPRVSPTPTPSRIVVNTHPTTTDEADEQTVVRSRPAPAPPMRVPPPAPTHVSSFNPLRIIIPSVAGLLVIFAVIYAFTRNTQPATNSNANQGASSLVADPNSQAVQPTSPPSGKNEEGIPAGGAVPNASPKPSPSATPAEPGNENQNSNTNENRNVNQPQENASPRSSPVTNTNQEPKPSPKVSIDVPPPPAPKPTATSEPPK